MNIENSRIIDEPSCRKQVAIHFATEPVPTVSLDLIKELPGAKGSDGGGGASRLAAYALLLGFGHIVVLDLSAEAIALSKVAMGSDADRIEWIVANVTAWNPERRYDVWHDRAAFNFLTDKADRVAYVAKHAALSDTGHAVIATFALDGPERCSGLPVQRYSPETLAETLGPGFMLVKGVLHEHRTPGSRRRRSSSVCWRVRLELVGKV